MSTKNLPRQRKFLWLALFALSGSLVLLSCKGSPASFENNLAIIKLNIDSTNLRRLNKTLNKTNSMATVDRVTVSVLGFDAPNERFFFYVEEQELEIDPERNVAEGTIFVELGRGQERTQVINGQEVTGEDVNLELKMFENGVVTFTGFTEPFFVAPGIVMESPPITLTSAISDAAGNAVATISVRPAPSVVFSNVNFDVNVAPEFIDTITDVRVTLLIPNGATHPLENRGNGFFTASDFVSLLGKINLEFVALAEDEGLSIVGRGTSFMETFVDLEATGLARNIELQGDFDIALGSVQGIPQIVWTLANPPILATRLAVEDIANNFTLWEIQSDSLLFEPNVIYGDVPPGAIQITPPENASPQLPENGSRYRISIEGLQNENDVSAQTEFTFVLTSSFKQANLALLSKWR